MANSTCPKCQIRTRGKQSYCNQCMQEYKASRLRAKIRPRDCIICSIEYRSPYPHTLTCSPECGRERERRKLGQSALPDGPLTCPTCGAQFEARNSTHRFCSNGCSDSERWKRRQANAEYMVRRRAMAQASHGRRYAKDPIRANENVRRYRATKRDAFAIPFTLVQLAARLAYWGNVCWMCGAHANAVDHVKPLIKGGPHMLANFRPACGPCNASKGGRWSGAAGLHQFMK